MNVCTMMRSEHSVARAESTLLLPYCRFPVGIACYDALVSAWICSPHEPVLDKSARLTSLCITNPCSFYDVLDLFIDYGQAWVVALSEDLAARPVADRRGHSGEEKPNSIVYQERCAIEGIVAN